MAFDFSSFRRLLFQDSLEDAINMLKNHGPKGYSESAERIASQLKAWKKSSFLNPFRRTKKSKYHEAIIKNLYQSGLSASKDETPPSLVGVHPWRRLGITYVSVMILLFAGLYFILHQPECPAFEEGKQVSILIDKFESRNKPLLQVFGLDQTSFENYIKGKLSLNNVATTIYPVNVNNRDDAKKRCDQCGANMLIWGEVDYKGDGKANLYHYLDHESYEAYTLKHGIPEAEEPYKGIFDLKTKVWIGEVTCLVNLFQGLMAKEKFQKATDKNVKTEAIQEADRLFDELSTCATDDSLRLFALHCLAWAKVNLNEDSAALETYNKILEIDSSDALALNNSALLYEKQDNFLYANIRYEEILKKNDIPYLRLANADALNKLNRKEEANKEIRHVKESPEYQVKKDVYDNRIRVINSSSFVAEQNTSSLAPSSYLSTLATKLNTGDSKGTIKGLDSLSSKVETATFSKEDILIMREMYKNAGASEKAVLLNTKAVEMGVKIPSESTVISKATRKVH